VMCKEIIFYLKGKKDKADKFASFNTMNA